MDGWGIAALAVAFSIGLALGVKWMSGRPIINNVTQKVETNTHVAGGGPGGVSHFVGGTVLPVFAIVAVVALAVAAVASSINANAQVSNIAQRSVEAQKEIVQAMPEPLQWLYNNLRLSWLLRRNLTRPRLQRRLLCLCFVP